MTDEVIEDTIDDSEEDLRSVIEDAYEADDTGDAGEETQAASEAETADEAPDTASEDGVQDSGETTSATEPAGDATTKSLKAPINYSPAAREQWSKVPESVKEQILAREQHVAETVAGTAHVKKFTDAANQMMQQHRPIMQAEGMQNPLEAAGAYMETVGKLRNGTPHERAGMVAEIINKYGVDISALDQMLVNGPAAAQPQQQQAPMQDPRVDQLLQQMEQRNQYEQQQSQQVVQKELQDFSQSAEFLGDVRMQMADMIDVAKANGRDLSLQEAYDTACQLNPQIKNILGERQKNEQLVGSQNSLAAKRSAASSLNGRKSGLSENTSGSIADALDDAWNQSLRG